MRYSWLWTGILPACILFLSCGERDIRFGTPEYWELPDAEKEIARRAFMEKQKQEGNRLLERSVSYGNFRGEMVARQYSAWLSWSLDIEDDPVRAAEIISEWKKELVHVRRERNRSPDSLRDLIAWLVDSQRSVTGSWAPDNAPVWLHLEEIARALQIIRMAEYPVDLKQRILPLGVIRDPAVVRTMLREALERSRETGYTDELSALAWVPWLRYATRSEIEWPESWDDMVRTVCIREWMDAETGGFATDQTGEYDLAATYLLIRGWNADALIMSYIPFPQKLARSLIAAADTLPLEMKPYATALLAGSIMDQDSTTTREICTILGSWQTQARDHIVNGSMSGNTLQHVVPVAVRSGLLGGQTAEWMSLAGCAAPRLGEYDACTLRGNIIRKINIVENITNKTIIIRYISLLDEDI